MNSDGSPNASNTRAQLREKAARFEEELPWFGIEQEYTLFDASGSRPFGWPKEGFPAPQGPYYCGVGAGKVYGRALVDAHLRVCLLTGLKIAGINAEVMPSQWEFQVGPLGPLEVSDELWLARWLLHRIGEDFEASVKLDPKPVDGDWNGAGAHTNFSTAYMRDAGGLDYITLACEKLKRRHAEHIKAYGAGNEKRLTGKHETCDIHTFRWGIGDRGASIRIPSPVAKAGCGYLEDRRPAANMDPYKVCTALLETICGDGFNE
jgi:glutamine synthetase